MYDIGQGPYALIFLEFQKWLMMRLDNTSKKEPSTISGCAVARFPAFEYPHSIPRWGDATNKSVNFITTLWFYLNCNVLRILCEILASNNFFFYFFLSERWFDLATDFALAKFLTVAWNHVHTWCVVYPHIVWSKSHCPIGSKIYCRLQRKTKRYLLVSSRYSTWVADVKNPRRIPERK